MSVPAMVHGVAALEGPVFSRLLAGLPAGRLGAAGRWDRRNGCVSVRCINLWPYCGAPLETLAAWSEASIQTRRRRQESHLLRAAALRDQAEAQVVVQSSTRPDLFLLDLASKLEDNISCSDSEFDALSGLREEAVMATLQCHWPTSRDESYRFTDLRFLKQANINPVKGSLESRSLDLSSLKLPHLSKSEGNYRVTFVDGVFSSSLSILDGLPDGVDIGSISTLSKEIVKEYVLPKMSGVAARSQGDVFACLNGVGAQDLGVVIVRAGVRVSKSIDILYLSLEGEDVEGESPSFSLSNPRLLIIVGEGAEVNIVEDFVGGSRAVYWSNSVREIFIARQGKVSHSYLQEQTRSSVHIGQTYIEQDEASCYKLVEACLGARLSRHNLHVQQKGPDTLTEFSSFLLAGPSQLHDLHSRLILDYPRGVSRQLHKCIVSDSTGHSVFDGNVRVNRFAQQTDAGQLSRSLLLAPRATVNVKPNLQIIADDVKCSHGAAISDLEEEQLFYFRARGIDIQSARNALVFSFGAEILQKLDSEELKARVEVLVKEALTSKDMVQSTLPVAI